MINYGYAFNGRGEQVYYGIPFFTAFNKENGEQIFSHTLNEKKNPILNFNIEGEDVLLVFYDKIIKHSLPDGSQIFEKTTHNNDKKNPLLDYKIMNDYLLLIFKDRIIKYSLLDGSQIFEKTINNNELVELQSFVGNNVYIDGTSSMTNLIFSDVSKSYITTSKGNVLIFDDELNIVRDIDISQLFKAYMRINDYKLINKGNQSIVLDADNNKVAELDITSDSFLKGNKIYNIRGKSLFEIDLTNLIEKQ